MPVLALFFFLLYSQKRRKYIEFLLLLQQSINCLPFPSWVLFSSGERDAINLLRIMKAPYPINGFLSYAFGERFSKVLREVQFLCLLLKSFSLTVQAPGVAGSPDTKNSRVLALAGFALR